MIDVIDWQLSAQVGIVVTAIMQILKVKPPFNRFDGEYMSAIVGILVALYFCLLTPAVESSWIDWMRCATSGLVAGVAASGAYNIQKALPFPNALPTKTEKTVNTST